MKNLPVSPIFVGKTPRLHHQKPVIGENIHMLGEEYYKIANFDSMEPFFMSVVSSSNHWMFIASTGGLSAGRINANHALFPYYTVEKLTENSENTGPKTLFLVSRGGTTSLWEPLSIRQEGIYSIERNLYKNIPGNVLIFEEINRDLELTYRYAWRSGDRFGFVKTSWLSNTGKTPCSVELLDGLQNLMPAHTSEQSQVTFGPLLDAYKRNELHSTSGVGLFTLNSTMTDLAEPSESLLATVAWQVGLDTDITLISSTQLNAFRDGMGVTAEQEIRGQRGAYFSHAAFDLPASTENSWHIVADVDRDATAVIELDTFLSNEPKVILTTLEEDLAANTASLEKIVAAADGLQKTSRQTLASHHFANVMFNEMRGGYFPSQYLVKRSDFENYVEVLDRKIIKEQKTFFTSLPEELPLAELREKARANGSIELLRFANSYLPLSFSRRHGDPSRPWNRFSINIKKKDGSQQLDYEGNWRDIFQNWEALAYSYPEFVESMIGNFLNATTADGYNPYRITRSGIDWEVPEPGNPWANIGYWSDHQIIYLLKLMEISRKLHPGQLETLLSQPSFNYANVPYRIKPYDDILKDPYNSIAFDRELDKSIKAQLAEQGNDAKLVHDAGGNLVYGSLTEKLLTLLLAKLVNFVPEGGIWMNTQRPEWNDANNALVGKGLSVVTMAYLRRFVVFMRELIAQQTASLTEIHAEVNDFYHKISAALNTSANQLQSGFNDKSRRALMDTLGQIGSDYRWNFYKNGFNGKTAALEKSGLLEFLDLCQRFIDHSLRANRRSDAMYHAYNVLHHNEGAASISYLYEMLEGQVAMLSSGLLNGAESLALLKSMRASKLYRADQHSYILYPDRELKGFIERNLIPAAAVKGLELVTALDKAGDLSLLERDLNGDYHFTGDIHNIKDVRRALEAMKPNEMFGKLVSRDAAAIEAIYEQTFHHDQFTGRSGTFFAYEGLGSIYWHMVSKLLLAVQETIQRTQDEPSVNDLVACYRDIRAGQCFNKTPAEYGAFPTDPYSHTPAAQGAKQPGMTGMVKEEILARQAELGLTVRDGRIIFDFLLFDQAEFLSAPTNFDYLDVAGNWQQLELPASSLAYTICQVPVILQAGATTSIEIHLKSGQVNTIGGTELDPAHTRHIFERDGIVHHLVVSVPTK